jgi:ABC-type Fe3+ transport system substrate-binding protein
MGKLYTRRHVLTSGLAMGLAAGATPAWAATPPWQAQWSTLQAAAKKEGKLAVLTGSGAAFRKWIAAAEAALGIEIEHQQQSNSDQIANKVIAERGAGVYSFDLIVMTPITALPRLRPIGALDPLRPLLFRPDVVNDKYWRGGFSATWADNAKVLGFPLSETLILPAINTDLVKPGELKNARSLLDPKWKEKIILAEIRSGSTRVLMTSIRMRHGDDTVRRLMIDQKPTFAADFRQQAEGLVRSTFAIAQGPQLPNMQEFIDAGLAKNVKFVDIPDVSYISYTYSLWLANRAPHPSAAKLFANWTLTQEGQRSWSTSMDLNPRRTDVPLFDPNAVPYPRQWYLNSSYEAILPELEKTRELMTKVTGLPA